MNLIKPVLDPPDVADLQAQTKRVVEAFRRLASESLEDLERQFQSKVDEAKSRGEEFRLADLESELENLRSVTRQVREELVGECTVAR